MPAFLCVPCGSAGKESACNAGDLGSIPGLGRPPGEGKGYPGGSEVKASFCKVGDLGSIPGLGRSPGEGKGYHSSILAWKIPWTTVHGVAKSRTLLSDFHIPSLEKRPFRSSVHFLILIGLFVFLVLSYMSCLYIFEIKSLSLVSFAINFSHAEGCLFTLLIVSFITQNLLSLIRSHLFVFVYIPIILGGGS